LNYATEYLVNRDARIQVINKFLAPPIEQISNFDIYNGMVALTDNDVFYPEHFVELELASMLHVVTWESSWTINRFFKWMHRKGYDACTPSSAAHLAKKTFKLFEWKAKWWESAFEDPRLLEEVKTNRLMRSIILHPSTLEWRLGAVVPHMTGEELLKLSSYAGLPQQYDFAIKELAHRIPPG
jgi:hypothetical protein